MIKIILVRHTEISITWKKRCYGISDVPLSRAGKLAIEPTAKRFAALCPRYIFHSGLSRTKLLATAIARQSDCHMSEDSAFQEMNFGNWESRLWTNIYLDVGHNMARLISEPSTYAPPQGETIYGMRDRVMRALLQVWRNDGTIIIVTHGGPIGAIHGTLKKIPAKDWLSLVPDYGKTLNLTHADLSNLDDMM
ncbi:MAG: histidine phosphatase family protein [Hyphomicrobiaceae bacterium]|nr:histidine phosphatase family protein [Hyphomicrobiaceae bacterium]